MYWLTNEGLQIAREWLDELRAGNWPRGRAVASKQAAVLQKLIAETAASKKEWWEEYSRLTSQCGYY